MDKGQSPLVMGICSLDGMKKVDQTEKVHINGQMGLLTLEIS